ncbi:MAG: hypothetical protein WBA23_14040 [Tunicatimonas sp.]|uniref:hypothetical protein n=1 Tax=Tunicatimonas sp. TaxID=1940096 RepID=UPI003C736BEE
MLGFVLALTACQEDVETLGRGDRTIVTQPGGPGGKVVNPGGGEHAYPKIIERTYIPDGHFVRTKCIAWRIEWPNYGGSVDTDQIPSFFKTSNGSLNSLAYLLSTDPANKKNVNFSLYLDEKIQAANDMGELWPWPESIETTSVYFGKIDMPVSTIKFWATERPSQFENYWDQVDSIETEVDYQEGDFFIYQIPDENLFGGIRIVSESPRIIEVYHAVPN